VTVFFNIFVTKAIEKETNTPKKYFVCAQGRRPKIFQGGNGKRPKISKKYRKIALFVSSRERRATEKRPKNSKKRPKKGTF